MELTTIMHDLAYDDKYRFHLAKPSDSGTRPLDVLTKSREDWLGWQRYKKKQDRHSKKEILTRPCSMRLSLSSILVTQ